MNKSIRIESKIELNFKIGIKNTGRFFLFRLNKLQNFKVMTL
jgi:hypothetical protein